MSVKTLFPEPLKAGDHICIVDPANAFTESGIRAAKECLGKIPFEVTISEEMAFRRGTLKERAERLNEVIRNPEYQGIFCMWGGYGTMTLLDKIDYKAFRENRPVFVGFSDITAMHLAIGKEAGVVTFHGPALHSQKRPTTPEAFDDFWNIVMNPCAEREFVNLDGSEFKVLHDGRAQGQLVGGNLTLLSRLMGTPYEIDTKGKILFFEEVGELPYKLHGMLTQLKLAGKLSEAAGIIVGALTDCDISGRPDSALEYIYDALADVHVPVLYNVRAGHICDPLTLPLGAQVRIEGNRLWQM